MSRSLRPTPDVPARLPNRSASAGYLSHMLRPFRAAGAAVTLAALAACASSFQLDRYETNEALYGAAREQFDAERWDNAVAAFEQLTLRLPARDTLLPRSHWYLGQTHLRRDEALLAAQSFVRLVENFPGDSLADDALFEAARAYQSMWRKPELDKAYGESAIATYQTLIAAYPQSPRVADAQREIAVLQDWMAQKDYRAAEYYIRRRAYDSAIIFLQDVARLYPGTPTARRATLDLLGVYRRIRYAEEAEAVCADLRTRYPDDAEVRAACGPGPTAPAAAPDSGASAR